MAYLSPFTASLCLLIFATVDGYSSHEQALRESLFEYYDKHSLPAELTTVSLRLTVKHFDMIEESQSLMVDAWMVIEWVDPRLSWDAYEFNGITKLAIPHSLLWKPDLGVYNSATLPDTLSYGKTPLLVFATGKVLFVPPVKLQFSCVMDLTYWPHDTHNCTSILGSWTHDGFAIDLQLKEDKPEMDLPVRLSEEGLNLTRGSWNLLDSSIVRDVKNYNCCIAPYITVHVSLMISRNAPAYAWIVKGPALGLSILTLVLFVLPPSAAEKVIFGILCLLLDMIFIAYSSFIISMAPSHTPLIVKMVCKQAMLGIASIVVAALSLRLARDPHTSGLSTIVKRPLIFIAGCLCLRNYKNLVGFTVWEVARSHRQQYSRTLKSDEFELRETGNGHAYSGEVSSSPGLDWLLLAAVIDRICLIVLIVLFIVNVVAFRSVL